jgi:hypothetical protein
MPWAKCDWKLWRQKKPVDTFVVDHVEKLHAENQARAKRVRMGPADGGRGRRIWPLCCTSMGRPCSAIGYGSGESIGRSRNNVIVTMSGYNGVSLRAMSNGRIGAQSTVQTQNGQPREETAERAICQRRTINDAEAE